ncbi:hypothetical protein EV702DRAFT_1202325 [Suillus placidus]|uniref:Uncharacterized protein n=1 Tax=Suillus placidus TaxID=48579 RepID=A0A9P7CYH2_9AGAM|nr:hypothetical protein EV702DRAFT_1202325 [Suillus placidus]
MSRGGGSLRLRGLSKLVISHNFRGRVCQTRVLMSSKQPQHVDDMDVMRRAEIQEMSTEDRDMVEDMMADYGMDFETLTHYSSSLINLSIVLFPHSLYVYMTKCKTKHGT